MKTILIDVKNNDVQILDIEPSLENYYKLIDCRLIDITERKIGDKYFDIICDDEGLLKDDWEPSAVNKDYEVQLVGNLIICKHDGEGNEMSLTDDEIENIIKNHISYRTTENSEIKPILTKVEF